MNIGALVLSLVLQQAGPPPVEPKSFGYVAMDTSPSGDWFWIYGQTGRGTGKSETQVHLGSLGSNALQSFSFGDGASIINYRYQDTSSIGQLGHGDVFLAFEPYRKQEDCLDPGIPACAILAIAANDEGTLKHWQPSDQEEARQILADLNPWYPKVLPLHHDRDNVMVLGEWATHEEDLLLPEDAQKREDWWFDFEIKGSDPILFIGREGDYVMGAVRHKDGRDWIPTVWDRGEPYALAGSDTPVAATGMSQDGVVYGVSEFIHVEGTSLPGNLFVSHWGPIVVWDRPNRKPRKLPYFGRIAYMVSRNEFVVIQYRWTATTGIYEKERSDTSLLYVNDGQETELRWPEEGLVIQNVHAVSGEHNVAYVTVRSENSSGNVTPELWRVPLDYLFVEE